MGWGSGVNADGREIGYNVKGKCDQPGCWVLIDRGLSYACGGMHDYNEHGCGGYYCSKHLYFWVEDLEDDDLEAKSALICAECVKLKES